MLLIDLNQVIIANLMQQSTSNQLSEDLVRHIFLNSLRSYNTQFKSKYGQIVICCDNKKYWRREVFPFYKASRKKTRDASNFDWVSFFEFMGKIKLELLENSPYKMIDVEGAEADDVIAVLTANYSHQEDILIISSDKDFVQLQKYPNVTQYSPILKRFIRTDDPTRFVKEHIIRGDRGDGIPNFLSPDNTFVVGERQKTISKKNLIEWLNQDTAVLSNTSKFSHGFKRNQILVDFDFIPENIQKNIIKTFNEYKPKSKRDFFEYLIDNRLKALIEVADQF